MKQTIPTIHYPLRARVTIPGSKSMTNRALLLAAMAEGVSELTGLLLSDDTKAFITALQELGIVIQLDAADKSCIVGGSNGKFPKAEASIWCDSAGTVARFMLAACATGRGTYHFDATEQLRKRPIEPLIKILSMQGIEFSPQGVKEMPFTLKGKEGLIGGVIEIPGNETGQFISALLMVAPLAQTAIEILSDNIVSRSYVDMTCTMMAEFGVLVRRLHQSRFLIPVPQRYKAQNYLIEPDLSTASYFFSAAAVTAGEITMQPFDRENSKQGDVKFLLLLEKMGCEMIESSQGFTVKGPEKLKGINIDMRDFSDTFMTLAAIAPFAETPTMITNIGHTRLQESNRIKAMCDGLRRLQIQVEEGSDWVKIFPSQPVGGVIDSYHDHRIAMAFSVIGLRVPGVVIENAECVSKTCPDFFVMWEGMLAGSV